MTPAPALSLTEKQVRFEYLTAKLVIECALQDVSIICYRYRSTLAEDLDAFKKGLSEIDPTKTPTKHMLGLAKDFAIPTADGKGYDWNSVGYEKFGVIAESLGLRWGGRWKTLVDKNHCEYVEGA